jgi:energy-coupling factor transport system permease protein
MYHTGVFISGRSLIYNIDPRVKLAFIVCLSILILWVMPPALYFIGIIILFAALAGGISLRTIGKALKPLLFFITLIFFAHILFSEGKDYLTIPHLYVSISLSGIEQGFIAAWRFLCLIVVAIILTMTTTPSALIAAIKYFLRPLKSLRVPIDDIAVMIMLALRLMPALLAEKEKIETAQKARGLNLRGRGLIFRIKSFLSLATSIMLGVFRRADETALAMEARGYAREGRTSIVELKLTSDDYLAIVLLAALIIILMVLNYYLS